MHRQTGNSSILSLAQIPLKSLQTRPFTQARWDLFVQEMVLLKLGAELPLAFI